MYYFCMCTASLSVVYILSVCLSAVLANKRVHYSEKIFNTVISVAVVIYLIVVLGYFNLTF